VSGGGIEGEGEKESQAGYLLSSVPVRSSISGH